MDQFLRFRDSWKWLKDVKINAPLTSWKNRMSLKTVSNFLKIQIFIHNLRVRRIFLKKHIININPSAIHLWINRFDRSRENFHLFRESSIREIDSSNLIPRSDTNYAPFIESLRAFMRARNSTLERIAKLHSSAYPSIVERTMIKHERMIFRGTMVDRSLRRVHSFVSKLPPINLCGASSLSNLK